MKQLLTGIALALLGAATPLGQAPESKPDSPAVQAIVARAKSTAGTMWADEAHFFCEAPRANSPNDPPIEPTKIFDNVYVIGNSGTVAYVLTTSAGLVMIDALGANQVESVLLPGFKRLGLDPAQVKAIIVGHGHADHFGGSAYMQEHFGSKVYISAADWTLMENPPPARGGRQGGPAAPLPKHDQVITEGQPIAFGDLTVQPVAIPGHTPGSMGFIFPVKDNGKTRMAALYRRNGADAWHHLGRRAPDLSAVDRALQGGHPEGQGRGGDPEPPADGSDSGEARSPAYANERTAESVRRRRKGVSDLPGRHVDLYRGEHRTTEDVVAGVWQAVSEQWAPFLKNHPVSSP